MLCSSCGTAIPDTKRADSRYCSERCRGNAACRRHYTKHTDKLRVKHKQWTKANPEHVREKQRAYKRAHPAWSMLTAARARSRLKGWHCDLTIEDILIPDVCPVLGIPLVPGMGRVVAGSPSLDRRDNQVGYVRGNVHVISWRANAIKGDATVAELQQVLDYVKGTEHLVTP